MIFSFYDLYYTLEDNGVFEYLLPFLLVFTISFAILEKTSIFGKENDHPRTNINVILSLILGLLIVSQFEIVQTMTNFLPKISLILVIAVMLLVLVGLFGAKYETGLSGILLGLATLAVLVGMSWALSPSLGIEVPFWVYENQTTIIIFVIAIIIIFLLVSGTKNKTLKQTPQDLHNSIEHLLKQKNK